MSGRESWLQANSHNLVAVTICPTLNECASFTEGAGIVPIMGIEKFRDMATEHFHLAYLFQR